jgi:hypothetical protein
LTIGSAARNVRTGERAGIVAQETASQFAGTNYTPDDPVYAAKLRWKADTKPYLDLPSNAVEAKEKKVSTRTNYREKNPLVEAKLFITGEVASFQTTSAKEEAVRLMKELGLKVSDISSLDAKKYDSAAHIALRKYFLEAMGEKADKPTKGAAPAPNPWSQ